MDGSTRWFLWANLVALSLQTGACDDPTFGRTFDGCILKNASRGGDEASRATATEICERHFLRAPTFAEKLATEGKAEVIFGESPANQPTPESTPRASPAATPADALSKTEAEFANLEAAEKASDKITADVHNRDLNVIVKKVRIEASFYDAPPKPKNGVPMRPIQKLTWEINTSIEPDETQTVTGAFDGGKAPSRFYISTATASMVVPHTNHPITRLMAGSDN